MDDAEPTEDTRSATRPFADLTPTRVLDAVEAFGLVCDGRQFALNSFENRVYQVGVEGGAPVIAKFYRPNRHSDAAIAEEHTLLDELVEAELPVAAPIRREDGTSWHDDGLYRVSLFPRLTGRAPDLEGDEAFAWIGRLLARMHAVAARSPFRNRATLSLATYGSDAMRQTLAGPLLPPHLRTRFEQSAVALVAAIGSALERVGPLRTLRLHGDLHPGNLLWNAAGPVLVDFDDACIGPAVQDLWMLLPGDDDGRERAVAALLEGYEQFRMFDLGELALIEPLRGLRWLHHAGWLSARYDDPAFPRAFPHAGSPKFWEEHVIDLAQQAERIAG